MPDNGEFSFGVIVDGQQLYEYVSGTETYVESSTKTSTSYKILSEDGSEVMVTPYKIFLSVPKHIPPRFYVLSIDGNTITRAFLRGGDQRIFWGTMENSEMKEFVFTFPVEPSSHDSTKSIQSLEHLGSIEIQAMEAINTGVQEYYYGTKFRPPVREDKGRATTCLKPLNKITKKDAMKITDGKYPLLYSGMGHTVMVKEISSSCKVRQMYVTGQLISRMFLKYRTRLALELHGVISPTEDQCCDNVAKEESVPVRQQESAHKKPAETAVKEFNKDQFRTKETYCDDVVEIDDSDEEINERLGVVQFNELQQVKQELSEDVMWKDRSIIWEGDDDCLITYVRKPWDISLIVLSDSEDEEHLADEQPPAAAADDDDNYDDGDESKTSSAS